MRNLATNMNLKGLNNNLEQKKKREKAKRRKKQYLDVLLHELDWSQLPFINLVSLNSGNFLRRDVHNALQYADL